MNDYLLYIINVRYICFQIMVLEKILESPLDCKGIEPVNPKENQPWIVIGRIDAEVEAPIFGHLMRRADSLEKTRMLERSKSKGKGEEGSREWDG